MGNVRGGQKIFLRCLILIHSVQFARSPICTVLLLVYAGLSTILTLISTGQVAGWWLIVVGVWVIIGTFNLHKDYKNSLLSNKI